MSSNKMPVYVYYVDGAAAAAAASMGLILSGVPMSVSHPPPPVVAQRHIHKHALSHRVALGLLSAMRVYVHVF
jgi:hypothetical protein